MFHRRHAARVPPSASPPAAPLVAEASANLTGEESAHLPISSPPSPFSPPPPSPSARVASAWDRLEVQEKTAFPPSLEPSLTPPPSTEEVHAQTLPSSFSPSAAPSIPSPSQGAVRRKRAASSSASLPTRMAASSVNPFALYQSHALYDRQRRGERVDPRAGVEPCAPVEGALTSATWTVPPALLRNPFYWAMHSRMVHTLTHGGWMVGAIDEGVYLFGTPSLLFPVSLSSLEWIFGLVKQSFVGRVQRVLESKREAWHIPKTMTGSEFLHSVASSSLLCIEEDSQLPRLQPYPREEIVRGQLGGSCIPSTSCLGQWHFRKTAEGVITDGASRVVLYEGSPAYQAIASIHTAPSSFVRKEGSRVMIALEPEIVPLWGLWQGLPLVRPHLTLHTIGGDDTAPFSRIWSAAFYALWDTDEEGHRRLLSLLAPLVLYENDPA